MNHNVIKRKLSARGNPGKCGQRVIPDIFFYYQSSHIVCSNLIETNLIRDFVTFSFDDSKGCMYLEVIRMIYSL